MIYFGSYTSHHILAVTHHIIFWQLHIISYFGSYTSYHILSVLIHFINLYEIIMSRIWAGIWLQIRFKIRMEHWEGVIDLRTIHRKFNFISLLLLSISQYVIRRCRSKQKCFIWEEDSGERDSLALNEGRSRATVTDNDTENRLTV